MGFDKDTIIFGDKSLSSLCADIYANSTTKSKQIEQLIEHLSSMIDSPTKAAILVPVLKEYLDVSIKNDEHLIKLAAIIQRLFANKGEDSEALITEHERKALMAEVKKIQDSSK